MSSNTEFLINNIIFERERNFTLSTKNGTPGGQNIKTKIQNHFFCLKQFIFFQDYPRLFILFKLLVGLVFFAFPFAMTSYLIKYSMDNPQHPKLYISAMLYILSTSIILLYVITLIVFKIINICRNTYVLLYIYLESLKFLIV